MSLKEKKMRELYFLKCFRIARDRECESSLEEAEKVPQFMELNGFSNDTFYANVCVHAARACIEQGRDQSDPKCTSRKALHWIDKVAKFIGECIDLDSGTSLDFGLNLKTLNDFLVLLLKHNRKNDFQRWMEIGIKCSRNFPTAVTATIVLQSLDVFDQDKARQGVGSWGNSLNDIASNLGPEALTAEYSRLIQKHLKDSLGNMFPTLDSEAIDKIHASWAAGCSRLIQSHLQKGDTSRAIIVLKSMGKAGVCPDAGNFTQVIAAVAKQSSAKVAVLQATKLWLEMMSQRVFPNRRAYSAMLNAFVRAGLMPEAEAFFGFMAKEEDAEIAILRSDSLLDSLLQLSPYSKAFESQANQLVANFKAALELFDKPPMLLKEYASILLEKAIAQPNGARKCSVLCVKLIEELPDFPELDNPNKSTSFKKTLLNRLQTEFETAVKNLEEDGNPIASLDAELLRLHLDTIFLRVSCDKKIQLTAKSPEPHLWAIKKSFGGVKSYDDLLNEDSLKLVGEIVIGVEKKRLQKIRLTELCHFFTHLFLEKILSTKIIMDAVVNVLLSSNLPDVSTRLECVCVLLKGIKYFIPKERLQEYLVRLESLSQGALVPLRLRLLCQHIKGLPPTSTLPGRFRRKITDSSFSNGTSRQHMKHLALNSSLPGRFRELIDSSFSSNVPRQHDVVSFSILMNGYARKGDFLGAEGVLERMQRAGVSPNRVAFHMLLKAYSKAGRVVEALQVSDRMEKAGVGTDATTAAMLNKVVRRVRDRESPSPSGERQMEQHLPMNRRKRTLDEDNMKPSPADKKEAEAMRTEVTVHVPDGYLTVNTPAKDTVMKDSANDSSFFPNEADKEADTPASTKADPNKQEAGCKCCVVQ